MAARSRRRRPRRLRRAASSIDRGALDHAGLSVADLDAAAAFYGRAFGFEREFAFELPGGIRG